MKLKMTAAVALALSATGAYAASDFMDTAQVVSSKPIIERVAEQRQECDPVAAEPRRSNNLLGPIIGGVLGGLLGHQVGQGRGQTAATMQFILVKAIARRAVTGHRFVSIKRTLVAAGTETLELKLFSFIFSR